MELQAMLRQSRTFWLLIISSCIDWSKKSCWCYPQHDQRRQDCRKSHPYWWTAWYRKDSHRVSNQSLRLRSAFSRTFCNWGISRFEFEQSTQLQTESISAQGFPNLHLSFIIVWVWPRVWVKRHHSQCLQVPKSSRSRCPRLKLSLKPSESQSVSTQSGFDLGSGFWRSD